MNSAKAESTLNAAYSASTHIIKKPGQIAPVLV